MKRKMYISGGSHLDPVWLWSWREGFQANKATFKAALDRMMEYDDFVFSSTSAQFFEWIEENEPKLFEAIRQRVKEGRWILCGGWWVEPDCNVPSGESFARHSLLAQRYFQEKFGITAKTGICVDSFGHNGMIPQILKKSGMENYMFLRPMPHEKSDLPSRTFLWQSPDGSRVTAYRIPLSYQWGGNQRAGVPFMEYMQGIIDEEPFGAGNLLGFVGAGNHGGGTTIDRINNIMQFKEAHKNEWDVIWTSPETFFEELKSVELPVVEGELQYHAPGCYCTGAMIKDLNRKAENALLRAEKFDAVASLLGKYVPRVDLTQGWKQLLFNQFHDTLAGTATEAAYYDARNQMGEVISLADRCENGAMQSMSWNIHIPLEDKTLPIVVFNPRGWEVTEPVVVEYGKYASAPISDNIAVVDSDGNRVLAQTADSPNKASDRRVGVTFMASVPALGYRVYRIVEGDLNRIEVKKPESPVLENDKLRVEFDPERGTVKSIWHKELNREFLASVSRARVLYDDTDAWGHTLTKLEKEAGEFKNAEFIGIDDGPVRTAIRFRSTFGDSILTQTYSLFAGEDVVRVESRINWREKRRVLKLDFAVNAENVTAMTEIPFGVTEKKREGREEAMQRWCDVSGSGVGLAIVNNNKYSVDFRENTMGVSIVRSQAYVHHDPHILTEEENVNYMEEGIHDFAYILKPHTGTWKEADLHKLAEQLNQPVYSMLETFHEGELPQCKGFFSVDADNVLLSAVKRGYDEGGIVLRLHEAKGEAAAAKITFMDTAFTASFAPWEIKTFLLKDGKVTETDLLEQAVEA